MNKNCEANNFSSAAREVISTLCATCEVRLNYEKYDNVKLHNYYRAIELMERWYCPSKGTTIEAMHELQNCLEEILKDVKFTIALISD